jgi:hypothetical protein
MIASMFNLDHRLTELRPSADEQRLARLRAATTAATRIGRSIVGVRSEREPATGIGSRPSRIAA